jgi:hypothetical protein
MRDTDMTVAEKQSVLASWACDRVQSRAAGYRNGNVVNYDDIIDALQSLDAGSPRTR